jgi:hypothetical protein
MIASNLKMGRSGELLVILNIIDVQAADRSSAQLHHSGIWTPQITFELLVTH